MANLGREIAGLRKVVDQLACSGGVAGHVDCLHAEDQRRHRVPDYLRLIAQQLNM